MAQLLLFVLIAAAAVVALKVALIVATLVFLIIKPKETIALIAVLGVLALIRNYTCGASSSAFSSSASACIRTAKTPDLTTASTKP